MLPDETSSQIHKVYTSPREEHAKRHFCGFCGTSLSYWSESPRSEADFIQLTLSSLVPEDLADLEELGLIPSSDSDVDEHLAREQNTSTSGTIGGEVAAAHGDRRTVGLPAWLDHLTEGSRLGTLRAARGHSIDHDGTTRVEWEIVEWAGESDEGDTPEMPRNGKRKLGDREGGTDSSAMEGISHP